MSDVTKSPPSTAEFGPDYFFTENRYSWINHANLARCPDVKVNRYILIDI